MPKKAPLWIGLTLAFNPPTEDVIYSLQRRLERVERVFERLSSSGVLTEEDLHYAELSVTLSHGQRIIKLRESSGVDASDLREATNTIKKEMETLEKAG